MALLLAVFQKMRVIREYNEAVREQVDITAKLKRATKNIKNKEKWYESLFTQIDSQAKMMQNQANLIFRNQCGMGFDNYGMMNPYSYNSLDSIAPLMANLCATGIKFKDGMINTNEGDLVQLTQDEFNNLYSYYAQKGTFPAAGEDGKVILAEGADGIEANKISLFMASIQQARQNQSMNQQQFQNMSTCFAQDISVWAENQKAMLECQKDQELEPLNYEETMLELDKAELEQRIEMLKAEKDSYNQLCQEEARNAAPKFGLS